MLKVMNGLISSRVLRSLFIYLFCAHQTAKALGNQKPFLLSQVENLLWEAIISIAKGRVAVLPALQNFFAKVSWSSFDEVTETERAFFSPGIYLSSEALHVQA